jgi:hypothetical protein
LFSLNGASAIRRRLREQRDQPLFLAVDHRRVKDQLAGGRLVIADQCPVVQAKTRIRQLQVIAGLTRQVFQMPTEVVAQVADQTASEWQLETHWQISLAQATQIVAQTLQEMLPLSSGNTASCSSGQALSKS